MAGPKLSGQAATPLCRGGRGRRGGRGARGTAAAQPALHSPAGSSLQQSKTRVTSSWLRQGAQGAGPIIVGRNSRDQGYNGTQSPSP
jgi:hypothetical protein